MNIPNISATVTTPRAASAPQSAPQIIALNTTAKTAAHDAQVRAAALKAETAKGDQDAAVNRAEEKAAVQSSEQDKQAAEDTGEPKGSLDRLA
jgi:hypothetical protein